MAQVHEHRNVHNTGLRFVIQSGVRGNGGRREEEGEGSPEEGGVPKLKAHFGEGTTTNISCFWLIGSVLSSVLYQDFLLRLEPFSVFTG